MDRIEEIGLPLLVDRERRLLDRIFGAGAYEIESSDPDGVFVRSKRLKLDLAYDARDKSIGSTLTVTEPWGQEMDIPDSWLRFLGDEIVPPSRNSSGVVQLSAEEQIRAELKLVARITSEIFSDPQKTRDAINFVRGYRKAYNDWASGAW